MDVSDSLCSLDGKESACNARDLDLIPESERSSGEGNGNPLQYSCLENVLDRGACQATVQGVTKSQTLLHQVGHSFSPEEQVSFNFMAAVSICSDFGAQENKTCHYFHFFPHLFTIK